MGNTLIQDSATGNIMGLNPGFIPIGMKEHGGIMYIASVNKEGKGEIGTIPSPIIRDFYKEKNTYNVNKEIPLGETPIQISNKFYPADKFIVNLDMEIDENAFKDTAVHLIKTESTNPADWQIGRRIWKMTNSFNGTGNNIIIATPIISYNSGNQTENLFSDKGIYKLNLYAKNNSLVKASDNLTSALGNGENHWFYHNSNYTFPKDLMEVSLSGIQKQFPSNSKPGYLAVGLELESVGQFSALPRTDEPLMVPYIYKKSSNTHYAYFPGFKYTTNSGLYINTLKNIKVIDEQTDKSVNIKSYLKSSTFTDSIDKLIIDGGFMPSKETDDSWALLSDFWCPVGFYRFEPQKISQQYISNNEFYISPIVWSRTNQNQLKSHSYTDIMQSYPRLGLFCADLGDKFDNWYRLELDYYDQFDGCQGHFEQRFNPYLNDVFGTNLSADKVEYYTNMQMGKETITETYVNTKNDDIYYQYYFPNLNTTGGGDDPTFVQNFGTFSVGNNQLFSLVGNEIKIVIDLPLKTDEDKVVEKFGEGYKYLYSNYTLTPMAGTGAKFSRSQVQWHPRNTSNNEEFILGFKYEDGVWVRKEKIKLNTNQTQTVMANIQFSNTALQTVNSSLYLSTNKDTNQTNPYIPLFGNIRCPGGIQDLPTNWFNISHSTEVTSQKATITLPKQIEYSVQSIVRTDSNHYDEGLMWQYWTPGKLDETQGNSSIQIPHLSIKESVTAQTVEKLDLINPYSITPYFLLKGTNENGDNVYVSRFGKANNTTLTYECNFELDKSGVPYNYLDIEDLPDTESYASYLNSYIKDLPRYYFSGAQVGHVQTLKTANVVQPGIYVLNMTSCPGKSNWIKSGASDSIIDLHVTINNKTYTDTTIKWYWRMHSQILKFKYDNTPAYFSPYWKSGVNDIGALTGPYNPLVLIVKQPCTIQLDFIRSMSGHDFQFQQIGLYRVNSNVESSELNSQLSTFKSDIYMYQDYMQEIATQAATQPTPAKQYQFTQRYGAFFREAYVFTEGIYNSKSTALNDGANHHVVESVTVGENTYYSVPYIPAEPYVLPVMLEIDSGNKVTYSWNTYFMSKLGEDPGFLITNTDGLPDPIKNQDNLNSLRTTNNS